MSSCPSHRELQHFLYPLPNRSAWTSRSATAWWSCVRPSYFPHKTHERVTRTEDGRAVVVVLPAVSDLRPCLYHNCSPRRGSVRKTMQTVASAKKQSNDVFYCCTETEARGKIIIVPNRSRGPRARGYRGGD